MIKNAKQKSFKNATFSGCGLRIWLSLSMGKTIHIQTYRRSGVENFQHASNSNIDHYLISFIRTKCRALTIVSTTLHVSYIMKEKSCTEKISDLNNSDYNLRTNLCIITF